MKMSLVLFLLLLGCSIVYSQQYCNCSTALEQLIVTMESEYPGFKEKTSDTLLYLSFKDRIRRESRNTEDSSCLTLLKHYLDYFKDGHVCLLKPGEPPNLSQNEIQNRINEIEGFYFKKISDRTGLLRISSFMYEHVDRIEALLQDVSRN